jgi:hypothetical protein
MTITAYPSSAVDRISSTPAIDANASSSGSTSSCSTTSGAAPGYGIETLTTGGLTSGNSSVLSRTRE